MAEPTSSTAGGFALAKIVGGLLGISIVSSVLGFLVLKPKTANEAAVRIAAALSGSTFLGPLLCVAVYWKYPQLFEQGIKLSLLMGVDAETARLAGLFMVASPILAMSGLPAWWVLGAIVLWLEKRKGRDIAEMAADAKADAKVLL